MTDRGILFSGPMVRALLAGTKTQTRRLINPQPPVGARFAGIHYDGHEPDSFFFNSAPGPHKVRQRIADGDRLYVREAWRTGAAFDAVSPRDLPTSVHIAYEADDGRARLTGRFRQGMHMPRWASRITLTVTEVRVQRLQDISEEDAIAEGIEQHLVGCADGLERNLWFGVHQCGNDGPAQAYQDLWESINNPKGYCADDEPNGWEANPWVVAYSFTVAQHNIDQIGAPP